MSIGVDFVLRASTSAFTAGLAAAKNGVLDLKKSFKAMDLGSIGRMIGVGGIVHGLMSAVEHARNLAQEAGKIGEKVDSSVLALVRFGDTMAGLKNVGVSVFGSIASLMEQIGMRAGALVYGWEAAADAAGKMAKEAEAAAKKMADDKLLELEKLRKDNAFKRATAEQQINILLREQVDLLNAQAKLQVGSIGHTEKQIEIEKNRAAIAEAMKKTKQEEDEIMRKVNEELTIFFTSVENGAKRIKETEEKRTKAAQELADQAEREAAAKAKQLEIEAKLKKLNDAAYADAIGFMSQSTLGRDDVQNASDATLKEIARRKQGNLQSLGPTGGGGLTFDDNYFLRIQLQNEINQVKAELATRDSLRRTINNSGIDSARRNFSGDPLVFDKLVQQFVQDSRTATDIGRENNKLLSEIRDKFKSGVPTISLTKRE